MVNQILNNSSSFNNPQLLQAPYSSMSRSFKSRLTDEMERALRAAKGLGLTIEVCGSWVWVFGANGSHQPKLQAAGFNWSYRKCCWYLCPKSNKVRPKHQPWEHGKIRAKYGSQALQV